MPLRPPVCSGKQNEEPPMHTSRQVVAFGTVDRHRYADPDYKVRVAAGPLLGAPHEVARDDAR